MSLACVRVSDESRTVSGREFHSDGPETLKLLCPYLARLRIKKRLDNCFGLTNSLYFVWHGGVTVPERWIADLSTVASGPAHGCSTVR